MLDLREHPSKVGGSIWIVDDRGWGGGGGVGHTLDVHKPKNNCVSESDIPPAPRSRVTGLQYVLRFGRFHVRYDPDVRLRGVGGGVCQTDDVGQEGGVQKVSFG